MLVKENKSDYTPPHLHAMIARKTIYHAKIATAAAAAAEYNNVIAKGKFPFKMLWLRNWKFHLLLDSTSSYWTIVLIELSRCLVSLRRISEWASKQATDENNNTSSEQTNEWIKKIFSFILFLISNEEIVTPPWPFLRWRLPQPHIANEHYKYLNRLKRNKKLLETKPDDNSFQIEKKSKAKLRGLVIVKLMVLKLFHNSIDWKIFYAKHFQSFSLAFRRVHVGPWQSPKYDQ